MIVKDLFDVAIVLPFPIVGMFCNSKIFKWFSLVINCSKAESYISITFKVRRLQQFLLNSHSVEVAGKRQFHIVQIQTTDSYYFCKPSRNG